MIRVVLVRFNDGNWAPYFCTDTAATAREILETVADRWAIEEVFYDVKEVCGAGQQQIRSASDTRSRNRGSPKVQII